jgi:SNF2 family DNA or RNA helicase
VQVIALLCALFDKTGTGKDMKEIRDRSRMVSAHLRDIRTLQDDALGLGQVVEENIEEWKGSVGLSPWHPVLIIVPPTIIESWKNSFQLFSHFSVSTYYSQNKADAVRTVLYGGADILLCPKSLFQSDDHFRELKEVKWKLVIIDEFHNYKGQKTKISDHVRELKQAHAPLVLGMTGTLMQNNHQELWNLCDLVETNYLGTWKEFKDGVGRTISLGR